MGCQIRWEKEAEAYTQSNVCFAGTGQTQRQQSSVSFVRLQVCLVNTQVFQTGFDSYTTILAGGLFQTKITPLVNKNIFVNHNDREI